MVFCPAPGGDGDLLDEFDGPGPGEGLGHDDGSVGRDRERESEALRLLVDRVDDGGRVIAREISVFPTAPPPEHTTRVDENA